MTTLLLSAGSVDLSVVRGDSLDLRLEVQEELPDGTRRIFPLTGATLWFTVKPNIKALEIYIQKTSADPLQIDIDLPLLGQALIHLTPVDTNGLQCRTYLYDIRLITASGQRYTIVGPAKFTVTEPVTDLPL